MRLPRTTAAVLTIAALALAGCGGSDGTDAAVTTDGDATTATTPSVVTSTTVVPAPTTTTTVTTQPAPVTPTTTSTTPSGGTPPPTETTTTQKAPTVVGDRPTIVVRSDGTARTTASDAGQAQIWCDAARQGSYDDQLGTATTLVISVTGSDATQRCELPR